MHQQLLLPFPEINCFECLLPAEDPVKVLLWHNDESDEHVWICRRHWHDYPDDFVRV